MKLILYIRTFVVCFRNLFTKENVKQMLIGSLIGQLIGWMFVLGLFLGCSKSESTSVSQCVVTVDYTTELEMLTAKSKELQTQIDGLAAEIQSLTKAQSNVKNMTAYAQLEKNIERLQLQLEELTLEQASIDFVLLNLTNAKPCE